MERPCWWPPSGRHGVVIGARKRNPSAPALVFAPVWVLLFRGLPRLTSYVVEYLRDPLSWRVLLFCLVMYHDLLGFLTWAVVAFLVENGLIGPRGVRAR
jgi:hypothetical protein